MYEVIINIDEEWVCMKKSHAYMQRKSNQGSLLGIMKNPITCCRPVFCGDH